ncbi:MAG: GEVED domain-containing protein, partial [Pirellulaceae bacterium]
VPTGIEDAETFSIIVGGGAAVVFELNNTDVDASADLSNVRIDFNNSSSVTHLANQIVLAIKSAGLNLDPVHEVGSAIVRIDNSTTAHNLNASNTHLVKLGEAGVPAAVGINLTAHFQKLTDLQFDDRQIAVAMLDAIEQDTILTGVEAWAAGGANITLVGVQDISDINRLFAPETSDLRIDQSWQVAFDVANPIYITEIEDRAANPLKANQLSGETKFTIQLGSVNLDYGDAADGLGQPPQNSYPVLSDSDAAIHMIPDDPSQTLWLGERLDRDSEGQSLIFEIAGDATAMVDGEQFVITKGTRSEIFEFETAGGVSPDTTAISIGLGQTAAEIAQTVATAINDANLGMFVQPVEGGKLLLGTNYEVSIAGAPNNISITNVASFGDDLDGDGYTVTTSGSGVTPSSASTPSTLSVQAASIADGDMVSFSNGLVTATFEFDDSSTSGGVTFGNFAVPFATTDTNEAVATALVAAMNQATVEADLVLNLNPLQTGADVELSGDDEDGVINPADPLGNAIGFLSPYVERQIVVTASEDGLLDGWIDFNRDGDWDDAAEQVFASQQVQAGANTLTIITPFAPDFIVGDSFARFRISSTGGLRPTGLAVDGETEDYSVSLVPGTPPVANTDPTTASAAFFTTTEDQALPNPAPGPSLLDNDTDADGDDFRIIDPADPQNLLGGTFTIMTANGATVTLDKALKSQATGGLFTYDATNAPDVQSLADPATTTPGVPTSLEDTFTYDLIEALPYEFISTTSGVVTITVTGANDTPEANVATAAAMEDGPMVQGSFNGDDIDADDSIDTLIYNITANVPTGQGTVANNGDGTFSFNPGSAFQNLAQDQDLDVNFSYTAKDQHGATSPAGSGVVTVTGVNDNPFAVSDTFLVDQDA